MSLGLTDGKYPGLSWTGLIRNGFAHAEKKGRLTSDQRKTWESRLDSSDIDELISAAEFMGRKLDAPHGDLYARWLENVFKSPTSTNQGMQKAVRALQNGGIPLCTLNYDTLLEQVTSLPTVNIGETVKVTGWMRREIAGILHLHGSWNDPPSCILGIRDYENTLANEVRDLIQRSLGSFRRLLFIGCGETFVDPNFSALIAWLRKNVRAAAPQHYALVKADEVSDRHSDPQWLGFVEPLSYGKRHDDLSQFLVEHFRVKTSRIHTNRKTGNKGQTISSRHARLLEEYRVFLLKDCGQMTIEGIRADMDTAQRRFDLERLFVPLALLPSPPEIPDKDPQREQKLLEWQEQSKTPTAFGEVFSNHKRLALLALPGGGKTLLLKRLTVAYADPARRERSQDRLPDMALIPVLIRCREWREHIHRPIRTLLRNVPDITGTSALAGLDEALMPLFKKGEILLLVDGLDEIHDDALRCTFVDHLEAFLGDYQLTRLVVTSREAGFSLVAPSLSRFCERWRIAPLDEDAIAGLCDHWQRLMVGESPEARSETLELTRQLLQNPARRRLAENPLLLTMLLVVKHGAGRLPPDRVSLYSRAVEVLLDTWNIKGHDPLNQKEAVPQLAFVAFRLLEAGKQTATEKELLALLEDARDKVPQIRRYAKDAPEEFLKRVELRSSLLMEAGRQAEAMGTVPFYQFRHLTFQEYLAAVAAAEAHYIGYERGQNVLTPLASHLLAEEWKEVVPMAAVLARKQAEPLMAALVGEGNSLRVKIEAGEDLDETKRWGPRGELPPPAARLLQCLIEEAEASLDTLTAALQLVAFFAGGCNSEDDWAGLCRGPYGEELLHQAWLVYSPMQWPDSTYLLNTCPRLAVLQYPMAHWDSETGHTMLRELLASTVAEEIARGLFTCAGLMWSGGSHSAIVTPHLPAIERHLFNDDPALWAAAARAWGWFHERTPNPPQVASRVLDRLLALWLSGERTMATQRAAYALISKTGMKREAWTPSLSEVQIQRIRESAAHRRGSEIHNARAGFMVAFHNRNIWSDAELIDLALSIRGPGSLRHPARLKTALQQLGAAGRRAAQEFESRRRGATRPLHTARLPKRDGPS